MAQFSTVAAITGNGTVFAIDAEGKSRVLKVGDPLQKGETVRTVGDVRVELMMEDGRLLAVTPAQSVRLDENVVESDQRPTTQDSAVAAPATADTVIQALERGGDLSIELEATAAGLAPGGAVDGGSSFVQLLRIVEGVEPLSYNYSFAAPGPIPTVEALPETQPVAAPPAPVTLGQSLRVEEESVPTEGGVIGIDESEGNDYTASGAVWTGGATGVVSTITIAGFAPVTVAPGGSTVFFDQNGDPIPASDNETEAAAQLTVNPDGTYTFTMLGAMSHDAGGGENDLSLPFVVLTGTASDGAPTTTNLSLSVQDDVPTIDVSLEQEVSLPTLTTQDADTIDSAFDTDSDAFASLFTLSSDMGADDGGTVSTTYALSIGVGMADTGLSSAGNDITLAMDGNDIVGSTTAGEVFRISVAADGTVTLTQYAEIDHLPEDVDGVNDTSNLRLAAGTVVLTASATIVDADGDSVSDTQALDISGAISFDDDVPSVTANAVVDGAITLTTQDAQTIGELTDTASASFAAAFLAAAVPVYGADGAGGTVIGGYTLAITGGDGTDSGLDSNGLAITLTKVGNDVVGSTTAGEVFRISVAADGMVTLTQTAEIDHLPEDVDATNDNTNVALANGLVTLSATATTTDGDNDTATATVSADLGGNIRFDDDVPSVTANAVVDGAITLTTQDAQTIGELTDTASASFAAAFLAAAVPVYGADGAGGTVIGGYTLAITGGDGTDSGLDSNGLAITLTKVGNDVVGSTTAGEVFRISVAADGMVTLTQTAEIDHLPEDVDATNDNTNVALANGLVTLSATATTTDGDNDTATATVSADLGGNIRFDDDVPSVTANAVVDGAITLTTQDAQTIGELTDTASASFAAAFLAAAVPVYGADGAGGTVIGGYTLAITGGDGTDSGLDSNGLDITLAMDGNDVVGSTTAGEVFRISVAADGMVTLTQKAEVDHIEGGAEDEVIALATGKVTLSAMATTTDGDNDTATATVSADLGGNIRFDDDVPVAVDEVAVTLTESHVADTDWLAGSQFIDKDDGYVNVTTINGLTGGDTLKIDWTTNGSATVNWELRSGSTVVASGTATDSATLSAALSSALATGNYDLWVDSSKDMTVSDVHVLHTTTTTDSGNVITGDPGADTVGADGAAVYSITYVNTSGTTVTEVLGGDGTADVVTQYGTLHIEADGDYTYTVAQNAVPSTETDGQVEDNFSYTLMDGDGDTDSANINYVINDIKVPSVLDVTMITNTNNQIQPVILTFVDQAHPEYAYARLFALGAQGQQGTFTPDAGFNIDNSHNYVVGLEAASASKVNLTDLTIEGVPIFGQATGGGGGVTGLELDDTSSTSSDQTALVAVIQPNTPPAAQALTDSTDGDDTANTMTDTTSGTVDYLYGASGADTLTGSSGTDILSGGAGADSVDGSGGNDVLVFDELDALLDGGAGDDVLRIDDGALALFNNPSLGNQATVDLTGNTAIQNVEVLLITDDAEGAADKGTTLVLRAEDVLNFTDADHTLTIVGSTSDQLDLSADTTATWTDTGTTTADGNFAIWTGVFNETTVTLKVENEVTVSI